MAEGEPDISSAIFTPFHAIFLLRLDELYCPVAQFADLFFCLVLSVAELLCWVFQHSLCIPPFYNFYLVLSIICCLFAEMLTLFMHCSLDLSEDLDCYFDLSIWKFTYLHFTKIGFWRFIFFLFVTYSFIYSFPLIFCTRFYALDKVATFPMLPCWSPVGQEPCQSAWSQLLVSSQTSVTVRATVFVFSSFQSSRVCQDPWVSHSRRSQLASRCGWLETEPSGSSL